MTETTQYTTSGTLDHKRRKLEADTTHVKADRGKGVATDKAKANYLSGQLRLRLQYAKLKVEHGWQRQTLSEVENLYFRHTHLTRPYPVISPGGRRSGRTVSSASFSAVTSQPENVPSSSTPYHNQAFNGSSSHADSSLSANTRFHGTLNGSSSSSSLESFPTLSLPSTPTHNASRVPTPLAPHAGFGAVTRYPISRSDSTSTLILESTPSLYHARDATLNSKSHQPFASSHSQLSVPSPSVSLPPSAQTLSQSASTFREPFDPTEPTEQVDSQLAALRSMISASSGSTSTPLLPFSSTALSASPAPSALTPSVSSAGIGSVMGSGLTYDSFWSTHGSASTSFRSVFAGQTVKATRTTSVAPPLQAHASAPAVMSSSGVFNGGIRAQDGVMQAVSSPRTPR